MKNPKRWERRQVNEEKSGRAIEKGIGAKEKALEMNKRNREGECLREKERIRGREVIKRRNEEYKVTIKRSMSILDLK